MTRTNKKWMRVYIDGYDMSGYTRDAGTLSETTDAVPDACLTDAVKNAINGQTTIQAGPINAVLDNDGTTYPAGMFATFGQAGTNHNLAVAIGTLANPAIGDPMFAAPLAETSFQASEGNGFMSVSLALDKYIPGTYTLFDDSFGYVLHPKGAETAVNSANTPSCCNWPQGASALGGIFVYHLFAASGGGAGTVVLKMQDSADGSTSWADVTGATSAALVTAAVTTTPQSGMICTTLTQAVKQYTRWQLVFGGSCTSATFFAGFIRQC
jgi:hypothetical protein